MLQVSLSLPPFRAMPAGPLGVMGAVGGGGGGAQAGRLVRQSRNFLADLLELSLPAARGSLSADADTRL